MKKRIIFLSILFLGMCLNPAVFAQKKIIKEGKAGTAKEMEMTREAFQKQQEAMVIQKEEMAKKSKELSIEFEKAARDQRMRRSGVMISPERGFFYGRTPEPPEPVFSVYSSDKSATLSLHKNFKDESASKKTTFLVDNGAKRIRFNISGTCRKGAIEIKISLPSGKTFTTVEIDPSADITWAQSLKVEEGDKKYTGKWIIEIKATKVEGTYSFSVSTL